MSAIREHDATRRRYSGSESTGQAPMHDPEGHQPMTDQPNPVEALTARAADAGDAYDAKCFAAAARDAAEALQILACTRYLNLPAYTVEGDTLTLDDGTKWHRRTDCVTLRRLSDAKHEAWNGGYEAAMRDQTNPRQASANPHPAPAPKVPQL